MSIKLYKNPARNTDNKPYVPYVPHYQSIGLNPEENLGSVGPGMVLSKNPLLPNDNPRAPRPVIRQPYAEPVLSPIGRGRGQLPNVGNNVEQTWSSVDGNIIDDISEITSERPMIDNNHFVSVQALGLSEEDPLLDTMEVKKDLINPQVHSAFLTENDLQSSLREENLSNIIRELKEDEYLLVVNGTSICSGSIDNVQEEARTLFFGEHSLCNGNPIPIDDIVVMKRIKIKIGLFLE